MPDGEKREGELIMAAGGFRAKMASDSRVLDAYMRALADLTETVIANAKAEDLTNAIGLEVLMEDGRSIRADTNFVLPDGVSLEDAILALREKAE